MNGHLVGGHEVDGLQDVDFTTSRPVGALGPETGPDLRVSKIHKHAKVINRTWDSHGEQNDDGDDTSTYRAAIWNVNSIEQENSADREVIQSLDPDLDVSTESRDNIKLWPMGKTSRKRHTELRL